ncbi:MAG: DUF3422 family protein [Gammaproteobacteria bacterium]|jgi:uncharacterized membrane-anchored protein
MTDTPIKSHELRSELYEELHARPFPKVVAPACVSHIAIPAEDREIPIHIEHLSRLARRYSLNPPAGDASCYYQAFPGFELRWERHTEFCSYSFVRTQCESPPFVHTAMDFLPAEWRENGPGRSVVAAHLVMLPGDAPDPRGQAMHEMFEGQVVFGSHIVGRRATIFTSFRIHSDGFARFLIHNRGLSDFQAGRTTQRVLEIETYRIMALLGYPVAKAIWPDAQRIDAELGSIIEDNCNLQTTDDERAMLQRINDLANDIERFRSRTNYRFSATRAYHQLVTRRLADLREEALPGMSSLAKFLDRRLTPAVDTCSALEVHLMDMSQRIARATEMLRTRVEMTIEEQNQSLLESLNRRGYQQLKLQQTVEGLSVAAISYYVVGLARAGIEGLVDAGWAVNVDIVTGVLVIPVVAGVWWLVRSRRRRIENDEKN